MEKEKMKLEKDNMSTEALQEKVQKIIKRIKGEKVELKKELNKIENKLQERAMGTVNSSGFDIKFVLGKDDNETAEILKNKAKKLKSALELPNYADAEFRKYSLIYLMEHLNEHSVEKKRLNEELAKLENEYYNLPQKMREIEGKRNNIIDGFARKMIEIGLSKETEGIGLYGAEYIMSRYEERCKEYEI